MAMPVKSETEQGYAKFVQTAIKTAMSEMQLRDAGDLYRLLYDREGSRNEVQTLRNRLNRGNPGADFIGLCVSKMPPLQKLGLAEFFGIKKPEQQ